MAELPPGFRVVTPNAQPAHTSAPAALPEGFRVVPAQAQEVDPSEMSWRERQQYARDELNQGPLRSSVIGGLQGATLGFGDELMAGLMTPVEMITGYLTGEDEGKGFGDRIVDSYSRGYGNQQEKLQDARENNPVAATVGELSSAVALPGLVRTPPGTAAAPTYRSAIGTGAATGGAYGFGSADGGIAERLEGGVTGAAIGGATGGVIHGIGNAIGNRAARATIPDQDDLRALGSAAYQAADDAGVIVAPQGVARLNADIRSSLAEFGYHPNLQPRVGVVLNELDRIQEGNVTLKGLDLLRRQARAAASSMDSSEKAIGTQIINKIDDFVNNLPAEEVVTGNVAQAQQALRQGRDYWSRLRKSEAVDNAVERAVRRADSTGTGGNSDNAIRQNVRRLLEDRRFSSGLTQAEREAAEQVVRGTKGQNLARLLGRLSPEGNGLMLALGLGGSYAAPTVGIPAMVVGAGAKRIADRATPANVQALAEVIRSGGQTAKQIANQARLGQGTQELVEALMRYGTAERGATRVAPAMAEALRNSR